MSKVIAVRIVGAPVACEGGVKDTWRDTAKWAEGQLKARFGEGYLHKPEEFSEQKSIKDLLAGLVKGALVALVTRLVERNPDLYDEIEIQRYPETQDEAKAYTQPRDLQRQDGLGIQID